MSEGGNKALCPFHNPKFYMGIGAVIIGALALRYMMGSKRDASADSLIVELKKEENVKV